MSRKICSAGVSGQYSFMILDTEDGVVAEIRESHAALVATHIDMEVAERWTARELQDLIERNYETD